MKKRKNSTRTDYAENAHRLDTKKHFIKWLKWVFCAPIRTQTEVAHLRIEMAALKKRLKP